jgi:cytochrome P450
MSDRQLRDEIMTLFLAGHETTANALTWTLYLISQNHDVESKIIEEIKHLIGSERPPTAEDIGKLQYLRNVFTESLRLYPPAWAIRREAIDNVVIGNCCTYPDLSIQIISYAMFRDGYPAFTGSRRKVLVKSVSVSSYCRDAAELVPIWCDS